MKNKIVAVKKDDKVEGITKDNYEKVVDRAEHLRERLTKHYNEHKGFPSLRYIIESWGFNISLKALCRHRKKVMEVLGVKTLGKPTNVLPRPKKAKEPKVAKKATVHPAKAHKAHKAEEPVAVAAAPAATEEVKTE